MSLPFINPFTLGIMLVVAVGTVAYNIWSTNQQHPNYEYRRERPRPNINLQTRNATVQTDKKDTKKRRKTNFKDDACSICFERLEVELKTLHCNHTYHDECITKWFTNDSERSCPLCRSLQQ